MDNSLECFAVSGPDIPSALSRSFTCAAIFTISAHLLHVYITPAHSGAYKHVTPDTACLS